MKHNIKMLYGNVADVNNPLGSSGSAYPLYRELDECCEMVGAVDASFSRGRKLQNTLLNFHPVFSRWKERRYKSMTTLNHHTQVAGKQEVPFRGKYNFYFQQRALFDPSPWVQAPYCIYTDCTHHNTLREWSPWSPFSDKELEQWLETEKAIYDNASLLFPWSRFAADSMINDYGQPKEKVFVAGSGINFTEIPPRHDTYDGKVVLYIGYDFERKGGRYLVDAFREVKKKIPNTKLIIAGPKQIDIDLPDSVYLLGPVSDRKVITELYRKASLFVMPSLYEPWGSVYLEAMGHGVPCIACAKAAAPEIITPGVDGDLVPDRNSHALAERMIHLLKSPETLEQYGRAARKKVLEQFTWKRVAQRMVEQISIICSESVDEGGACHV